MECNGSNEKETIQEFHEECFLIRKTVIIGNNDRNRCRGKHVTTTNTDTPMNSWQSRCRSTSEFKKNKNSRRRIAIR